MVTRAHPAILGGMIHLRWSGEGASCFSDGNWLKMLVSLAHHWTVLHLINQYYTAPGSAALDCLCVGEGMILKNLPLKVHLKRVP